MATYSEKTFDAARYDAARPSYPAEFYDTLVAYHQSRDTSSRDLAVDVGCGLGFVAFELAERFKHVIGTDVSATMIEKCKGDARSRQPGIEFVVGSGEQAPEVIAPGSVDLITGAECCHWMDHPRFFEESHRILKPSGTLAFWFYMDPVFVGQEQANKLYMQYCYLLSVADHGDKVERFFGPYYEQPGHDFFRNGMRDVKIPGALFTDVVRHEYHPEVNARDHTTLLIARHVTLRWFHHYVTSWSGYHNWKAANPQEPDTADRFVLELAACMQVDWDTEFELVFPTVYTFARKRGDAAH